MATRRTGSSTAFWNAAAVGAGGLSNIVRVGRGKEQVAIFVDTSAATDIIVTVAHHGNLTAEGNEPNAGAGVFHDLFYASNLTPVKLVFAGAGQQALIIPDFEPEYIQLRSTGAATITAGFEGWGD